MLIKSIKNYLADKEVEIEESIYLNFRGPKEGISINSTGGFEPNATGLIKYPTVQVVVKYKNPIEGDLKIKEIYNLLINLVNVEIDNYKIHYCKANQEPAFFMTENDCFLYVCNFTFTLKGEKKEGW